MSHKRQRIESETAAEEANHSQKRDEFLITLGGYATIKLTKTALQSFPTSLLTTTLLGDGIDEHSLYVPIGRGHHSFPALIKDVYDLGAPLQIPPLGLPFDHFVKWLRYLGLATAGREISRESEAAERVSFFVETLLNTAVSRFQIRHPYPQSGIYTMNCFCVPPDIHRHLQDLVPYEFARRGIHLTVEKLPERTPQENDVNLSRLTVGGVGTPGFVLKSPPLSSLARGAVSGVFFLGLNPGNKLEFIHMELEYQLRWTELDGDGQRTLRIIQPSAPNSFNYEWHSRLESIVVVRNSGVDLIEEFRKGDMVYSPELYGESLVYLKSSDGEVVYMPFIHNFYPKMSSCVDEDLINAYVVVIASKSYPILQYEVRDSAAVDSLVFWRFDLEESPEWALVNEGQPPSSD